MKRVLVEGGASVLASFARAGAFDRWTVYYAPVVIGGTTAPSMVAGTETATLEQGFPLRLESVDRFGEGFVATFVPRPR